MSVIGVDFTAILALRFELKFLAIDLVTDAIDVVAKRVVSGCIDPEVLAKAVAQIETFEERHVLNRW